MEATSDGVLELTFGKIAAAAPSLAMVFPAWWWAAWSAQPGIALVVGILCAVVGAAILLGSTAVSGQFAGATTGRTRELEA